MTHIGEDLYMMTKGVSEALKQRPPHMAQVVIEAETIDRAAGRRVVNGRLLSQKVRDYQNTVRTRWHLSGDPVEILVDAEARAFGFRLCPGGDPVREPVERRAA